jgi:hypothetical protein
MIHTVYTRQRYDDGPFMKRMLLAVETCIPAMIEAARQVPEDVVLRWAWRAHARHSSAIYETLRGAGWSGGIEVVDVFGPASDQIQSSLDSDDRIGPGFLRMQQGHYRPGGPFIVTWQPEKQRLEDGRIFRHRMRYKANLPSPFYAVFNPGPTVHAYRVKHGAMHTLAPCTLSSEPGAIAVIHAGNKHMDLNRYDLPMPRRR